MGAWRQKLKAYLIRIGGHLGETLLTAFPEMEAQQRGGDCVLTGILRDRSELFGVIWQIEALGLELIEIRPLTLDSGVPERRWGDGSPIDRDR
jgi:hypothetical protein